MNSIGRQLAVFAVLVLGLSPVSQAEVVTFSGHVTDRLDLAGPQVEGSFTYTATGAGWEIQAVYGNPIPALVTYFNFDPSLIGQKVDFKLTNGGTFLFQSVDFSTIDPDADQVTITGLVSGNPVGSILLSNGTTTFQTVPASFGQIDLLRVQMSGYGSSLSAAALDNFVLLPVPEPTMLALAAMGIFSGAGLAPGFGRRRRRNN